MSMTGLRRSGTTLNENDRILYNSVNELGVYKFQKQFYLLTDWEEKVTFLLCELRISIW